MQKDAKPVPPAPDEFPRREAPKPDIRGTDNPPIKK